MFEAMLGNLRQPPPDRPADWPASRESRWAKTVNRIILSLLCHHHVIDGYRYTEVEPPYLVASNHLSYWDVPAMNLVSPVGTVGMAARKYRGTWREIMFELYPILWVTQFSADRQALRDALTILKGGESIAIAPEGRRSLTGALEPGTDGVAYLATRAGVPVIPAAVWGTENVLKQPRPHVYARVGRPLHFPPGRAKGDELAAYTERIMCAIAALLPEQYHGHYAGHPLIDDLRPQVS